jgi:homoserine dehydrogenase
VGIGNVGKELCGLIEDKRELLNSLGMNIVVVSISDSKGTAIAQNGLKLKEIVNYKRLGWQGFSNYKSGYRALDAIRDIESDVVVELTPSTPNGEPGLSIIQAALKKRKHVVTSNKGPLVVAYKNLVKLAEENNVKLLYEATVAAHVPVFCMLDSCFKADKLLAVRAIFNATTNFIIGEMETGKSFQKALNEAIGAGWAEANYSDDVDGIDAARKVVILANTLFQADAKLEDVKIEGIRNIGPMIEKARVSNRKVKLICEILREKGKLKMSVAPKLVSLDDSFATVNQGNMAAKFTFETSKEVFVTAQFTSPKQTACAVLNDLTKIAL